MIAKNAVEFVEYPFKTGLTQNGNRPQRPGSHANVKNSKCVPPKPSFSDIIRDR